MQLARFATGFLLMRIITGCGGVDSSGSNADGGSGGPAGSGGRAYDASAGAAGFDGSAGGAAIGSAGAAGAPNSQGGAAGANDLGASCHDPCDCHELICFLGYCSKACSTASQCPATWTCDASHICSQ